MTLTSFRGSAAALVLAVAAWSAGCATAQPPAIDPAFGTGAYVPARIAILPPDVFVVLDQFGDNDPVQSAALGQAVTNETVRAVEQALRARGYDVDLSARWDGIVAQDGSLLVNRDELGTVANGVLQFGAARASGQMPVTAPGFVAPELAAKIGWATQSDALLYLNVKGVATTSGKRTASILAGVFIVVIVLAIVLALVANSKGGGGNTPGVGGGGFHGQPVARAPSSFHGTPPVGGHAGSMPSGGFPRRAGVGRRGRGHAVGQRDGAAGRRGGGHAVGYDGAAGRRGGGHARGAPPWRRRAPRAASRPGGAGGEAAPRPRARAARTSTAEVRAWASASSCRSAVPSTRTTATSSTRTRCSRATSCTCR